jgi:hypothetical protein
MLFNRSNVLANRIATSAGIEVALTEIDPENLPLLRSICDETGMLINTL